MGTMMVLRDGQWEADDGGILERCSAVDTWAKNLSGSHVRTELMKRSLL